MSESETEIATDKAIFVFRNDLRLHDNTALIEACSIYKTVIPIFIFTPEQVGKGNKYKSNRSVQFMCESLKDLDADLRKRNGKLQLFYGKPASIVRQVQRATGADAIYMNANYTPYSIHRDIAIHDAVAGKCEFGYFEDYLLHPLDMTERRQHAMTESRQHAGRAGRAGRAEKLPLIAFLNDKPREVYRKFTPFFTKMSKHKVAKPVSNNHRNFYGGKLPGTISSFSKFFSVDGNVGIKGGRKYAMQHMARLKKLGNYNSQRNKLVYTTSQLGAYIKFGCVSPREVYYAAKSAGAGSDFIKQLYWRDFYIGIAWKYPDVLVGRNRNLQQKYSGVGWIRWSSASSSQRTLFKRWCSGNTGFPIIDACMRELNETGWMHNRGRLLVAGFLVKLLGWHWEDGELYFAKMLVDYDSVQNNGNWQFVAGSGVDVQRFYRIFNPWRQQEKHDSEAKYIKDWLPELAKVPAKDVHKWFESYGDYPEVKYPKPMIDYETYRDKIKAKYLKVRSKKK